MATFVTSAVVFSMDVLQRSTKLSNLICNSGILSDALTTTSAGQSMALVRTLPITLSNRSLQERYMAGV